MKIVITMLMAKMMMSKAMVVVVLKYKTWMAWTWPVLFTRILLRSEKPLLPRSRLPQTQTGASPMKTTLNLARNKTFTLILALLKIPNHFLSGLTKCSQTPRSGAVAKFHNSHYSSSGFAPTLFTLDMQLTEMEQILFSHWRTCHDPPRWFLEPLFM